MRPSTSQMTHDRQVLAGFSVGKFDAVRVDALVRQWLRIVSGGLGECRLVQDRDLVPAGRSSPSRRATRFR